MLPENIDAVREMEEIDHHVMYSEIQSSLGITKDIRDLFIQHGGEEITTQTYASYPHHGLCVWPIPKQSTPPDNHKHRSQSANCEFPRQADMKF